MAGQFLLVSDLDGTLLGQPEALERFARWRQAHQDQLRLAYNSGRFYESICELVAEGPLPAPDAVIGGVGTEIRLYPGGEVLAGWPPADVRWDRAAIQALLQAEERLQIQPEDFQSPFKLSYYAYDLDESFLQELRRRLAEAGHPVEVVYSSSRDLDILPAGVNKGSAAAFLASFFHVPVDRVIVAGDTGNDAAMFICGFRGIVVANAQPELKALQSPKVYHASCSYADGVLEGLEYWMQSGKGEL